MKKFSKPVTILISVLVMITWLALLPGCEKKPQDATEAPTTSESLSETSIPALAIATPRSPGSIPVLRLIDSGSMSAEAGITAEFYNNMDAMMVMATNEGFGLLILPAQTASVLYNKGFDIELLGVFNWGGVSLSTTDPNCRKWEDLKGRELYVPSRGSVPDLLTQYFLFQHGMTVGKDITVVYSNHVEISQLLANGTSTYAVDAEPFVTRNTQKLPDYHVITNYITEWQNIEGKTYGMPGFCLVGKRGYVENNRKLVGTFIEKVTEALLWTKENPVDAGDLAQTHLNADADLIATAMDGFHFNYKTAIEVKEEIKHYYTVLLNLKPESIGGRLPDEGFYYTE